MKTNQIIIPVTYENERVKLALPNGINESNADFYLVKKNTHVPIRKIYAQTFWILNAGHDFSVNRGYFQSSSDIFKNGDLLIEYGSELELHCNRCQAPVLEIYNFCTDCGKSINWDEILKDKISTP